MQNAQPLTSSKALKFVLILGVVNLFADMTYEGARSVTGRSIQPSASPATALAGANM